VLYTDARHTTKSQKKSIGKHSIATSEQGNAADKATGESFDAKGKMMVLRKEKDPTPGLGKTIVQGFPGLALYE
jgi:hypothetical protein